MVEVINHDPVPHSFTECTGNCEGTFVGSERPPRFDIPLPPESVRSLAPILEAIKKKQIDPDETLFFFCTVHQYMRGAVTLALAVDDETDD